MTSITIDALHPETARVETEGGTLYEIPRSWLPSDAREGDVLSVRLSAGAGAVELRFAVDEEAGAERRKRVRAKLDQVRERLKRSEES